jgi:hypothetical protein
MTLLQGTVAGFDAESRTGSVFLDDGSRVGFGRDSLEASRVRILRPGQRVRLRAEPLADGGFTVVALALLTMPLP